MTALQIKTTFRSAFGFALVCAVAAVANAQDNYEIQVYGSETIPHGVTMIELHNNFTFKRYSKTDDVNFPINQA